MKSSKDHKSLAMLTMQFDLTICEGMDGGWGPEFGIQ